MTFKPSEVYFALTILGAIIVGVGIEVKSAVLIVPGLSLGLICVIRGFILTEEEHKKW